MYREKALIVGAYPRTNRFYQKALEELKLLCESAGIEVVGEVKQIRDKIDSLTVIGSGKLEEVKRLADEKKCSMVIFDNPLKPAQWKKITSVLPLKTLDRCMLILDIFAQRAKSSEGKIKVELAQLEYNLPRLTELDSGLSRLVGGIGGRGPGETKLEVSRRRTRERIKLLQEKLRKIEAHRNKLSTRAKKRGVFQVSILGYTNAGKSSLFNALLKKAEAFVENKVFATLDPLKRKVVRWIENSAVEFVLVDTVGFIRDLPKQLEEAFKATVKEALDANLLLLVVDISDEDAFLKFNAVKKILLNLGARWEDVKVVLNKIDVARNVERLEFKEFSPFYVSAKTGEGLNDLLDFISWKAYRWYQLREQALKASKERDKLPA